LGSAYPDYFFIPEGDTPTFLYLIQNGLSSPEHPNWGSWGGRYALTDPALAGNHYSDATDHVIGANGQKYVSNHATIWRWRDAFQNDFAARMQWTLTADASKCNHAPVVIVNDDAGGPEPVMMEAEAGTTIELDASKTYDPDGDDLTFSWWQYKDITATQWQVDHEVETCTITPTDDQKSGRKVEIQLPSYEKCTFDMFSGQPKELGQILHFILEVKDSGTPSMVTYKRVVVQTTNRELKGKKGRVFESVLERHVAEHEEERRS
jgi:hypothetical protein